MTSGQKTAFSFLSALLIFGAFVVFAQTGLMSKIETKFYAQSKLSERQAIADKISDSCNSYISNILSKVQASDDAYLKNPAVKSFVEQNPSEKDEIDRRNLTIKLLDELEGIDGMRLIENNGRNIHYSTYDSDVMKVDGIKKQYKNYPDVQEELKELKTEQILVNQNNPENKILFDSKNNRLVLSFPFYITEKTCFGTLVCYINQYNMEQMLINKGEMSPGETLITAADDSLNGGFIIGVPSDGQKEFTKAVLDVWSRNNRQPLKNKFERILEGKNDTYWIMMQGTQSQFVPVGIVVNSKVFELPRELIYLIYVSVFITILLITLLVLSLNRDPLTVIKQRIKKIQFGMINEYLENKQNIEWSSIARQLEFRKDEFFDEIKKSINGKSKKYEKDVNLFLNQSWEEIINVINSQNKKESSSLNGASIEEIRRVIEEVLQTAKLNVNVQPGSAGLTQVSEYKTDAGEVEEIEEIEEIGDVEDVEAVEEIEEIGEAEEIADAEEVEEINEIEEIEDAAEIAADGTIEEVTDDSDKTEVIEEIADAEELTDAEDDVDAFDDVEEILDMEGDEASGDDIEVVEEEEPVESETAVDIKETSENKLEKAAEKIEKENRAFTTKASEFVEDLSIGNEHQKRDEVVLDENFGFVAYVPDFYNDTEAPADIEDLLPVANINYSLTEFGQDIDNVTELEGEVSSSIVENKGIYSISNELEYSHVVQDPAFKQLVDSVIKN